MPAAIAPPIVLALVVDIDPFMRAFAQSVLHDAGLNVAVAANCADGLDMAAWLLPDLILLDYAMPGGIGIDFLRVLRSNGPRPATTVIVLSAWESQDVRRSVEALGAMWVDKPVSAERLGQIIQAATADLSVA